MSTVDETLKLLGGLALILIALVLVLHFTVGWTVFEANRQAGQDIAREEMDRESALQNYRWFRSQWFQIQENREQLENYLAQEERFHEETWPDDGWREYRDARTEHERLHQRIAGAENQLDGSISEYNSRQSDATRAIFNCGLPWNIDEKLYIADGTGVEYTSQEAASMQPPENPEDCQFSGTVTYSDE